MIRNYFKTAVRNLLRHRFFSAINIFGLALAMSICMGIIMLVADQMQYDRYNTKKDVIYRITSIITDKDLQPRAGATINSTTPMILGEELKKYSNIEHVVQFKRGFGNGWIEFDNQDVNIPLAGYFADAGALEMFEFELQYGDAAAALRDPYSVVLTRKAADKLFSDENPVGQTIRVGDKGTYTVTGVLKETENKTHIAFEALASMASLVSLDRQGLADGRFDKWNDFWSSWTYVQVKPGVQREDLQRDLNKVFDQHIATFTHPDDPKMRLQTNALTEITPGPLFNNPIGPSLPWFLVYILGGLAGVIMITSCFNFTNLSIARSLTRAREIGVRKVNGASRTQIFFQFISEAVVVAFCALILSFGFLMAVKPLILRLTFARVFRWDLASNFEVYGVFVAFTLLVGLLAGLFPAVVLSGFKPVKVLKNLSTMRLFTRMGLRKTLLVSQFTLALVFILSVSVLYRQLDLFLNASHGFDMEQQLRIKLSKTAHVPLKNELLKHSNIQSVSVVSHLPASGTQWGDGMKKEMSDAEWTFIDNFIVDEDYAKNLGLSLAAGKFFDGSSKDFIVVNEATVKALHYATNLDAIGTTVILHQDSTKRTIVGVLKDYNHQPLLAKIKPLALLYDSARFSTAQVKYSGSYEEAIASVNEAWNKVNPGLKADIKEMKADVMIFYDTVFGDAVKVLGFIAFLAIFISCLGLLGMATYATESRVKEVSVRKVLGISNGALIYLLSKGFLVILAIAIVIGVPAAYFINTLWLELIAYHVTVDLPVIAFGISMLLVFSVITIGSQTWRATFVNPVDNLKND